jgi:uncharacterized protein with FMN-binding domain
MNKLMNKYVLSAAFIASFALYAFIGVYQNSATIASQEVATSTVQIPDVVAVSAPAPASTSSAPVSATATPSKPVTTPTKPTGTTTPTPKPVVVPAPVATSRGPFKDGAYTGDAVDHQYGTVQVKAVVTGGNIADVSFLQYPSHAQRSQNISAHAMPLLTAEAIQVQNEKVNIVSGATLTSYAFRDSLGSALAQAK